MFLHFGKLTMWFPCGKTGLCSVTCTRRKLMYFQEKKKGEITHTHTHTHTRNQLKLRVCVKSAFFIKKPMKASSSSSCGHNVSYIFFFSLLDLCACHRCSVPVQASALISLFSSPTPSFSVFLLPVEDLCIKDSFP